MRALIVLGLVCSFFIGSQGDDACPRMWSRSQWGADQPQSSSNLKPKPRLVLIKEAGKSCSNRARCTSAVKALQDTDIHVRTYPDIQCSFLIGSDGQVYEGRGWSKVVLGADTIVICMLGKFDKVAPATIQSDTLKKFIRCSYTQDKLSSSYKVKAWSDVFTILKGKNPGPKLYKVIQGLPQYSAPATTE